MPVNWYVTTVMWHYCYFNLAKITELTHTLTDWRLKLNIKLQLQVLLEWSTKPMAVEAVSFHDKHLLFPDIKYAKFILQILKSNILFIQRSQVLNHLLVWKMLAYTKYSDYILIILFGILLLAIYIPHLYSVSHVWLHSNPTSDVLHF